MLIKIKPHSAFKRFFQSSEYVADIKTYNDILFYLNGMHKSFIQYARKQKEQNIEESFVFLDKHLKIINPDELKLRHAKDGDIIHIVPAIVGGGGKRGGLLAVLAIAAFAIVALPAIAVGTATYSAGAGLGASIAAGLGSSPILLNLALNVGLALVTSLFASKPSEQNTRSGSEEGSRENGLFGSLTNTTASGTPIALNYGMVRVAGQLINGYVQTTKHTKAQNIDVYGRIYTDTNTSVASQVDARKQVYEGFNSFT